MPKRITISNEPALPAAGRMRRGLVLTLLGSAMALGSPAFAAERATAKKMLAEKPVEKAPEERRTIPRPRRERPSRGIAVIGAPRGRRRGGLQGAAGDGRQGLRSLAGPVGGRGERRLRRRPAGGWSERGDRPVFGVVTGVSTGALIAPFAFVGPQADGALKQNYTEISAADVFEFGGTRDSLTDTWPLKERIERSVTPALLKAVAAEHAKGRAC